LLACTRPKKVWILSVSADAKKILDKVEFCEPYGVWVGGIYPDHIVPQTTFDPDLFVSATLAHNIKVGLVTVQDVPNGLSPMKIIAARPQTRNEKVMTLTGPCLNVVAIVPTVMLHQYHLMVYQRRANSL
jgi:hypothetical protein